MTIEEMRQKRMDLLHAIQQLVDKFETETSCEVVDIGITRIRQLGGASHASVNLTTVVP